jgi:hypothetical protein
MGVRGPQPSPNARRNGAKVYISPAHAEKLDKIRESQSRADWLEQTIDEYWENTMNSYQVKVLRESDPVAAYEATVAAGEGRYVWQSQGQYSAIASADYNTIEDLRHGCGEVYVASKRFDTAAEAANESTLIPNAMADAYLRDIARSHHGTGFRVH